MPQKRRLAVLNQLERSAFTEALAFAFEKSPWIPAAAWDSRPFADRAALHRAMCQVVQQATREQQLALIRAHPDLAGKAAIAGELTAESTQEQAGVGLDRLTPEEFAEFHRLNNAYQQHFAFPFIICVREHTRDSILDNFRTRLTHDSAGEISTALAEIEKIAWLRLQDALEDD